jgi:hypothetical protein
VLTVNTIYAELAYWRCFLTKDSVVKMGPCGGSGNAWKIDTHHVDRIFRAVVRHGWAVDAMSVLYERDGQEEESKLWGGTGEQPGPVLSFRGPGAKL